MLPFFVCFYMKKILYTLYLLLWVCNIFAQTPAADASFLSLLDEAEQYKYRNMDSAVLCCNMAVGKAQTPAELVSALRTLGYIYEVNNKLKIAQETYKKALDVAETKFEDKNKLDIYTDWAIIHKKLGQYNVANEYHLKSIDIAQRHGDWEMVENGYNGLGTMYSMMSDFEKSMSCYLKSIEAAEHWDNVEGVILSKQNIASILLKVKNISQARSTIQETYQMAILQKDTARIAAVLCVFAQIEIADGQPTLALQKMTDAKSIFEKKGNMTKLSEALVTIADLYIQQKNYAAAESYFKQSMALSNFMIPYTMASMFTKYGKLCAILGKDKAAIQSFKRSLLQTDSLGFKEIALENHSELAKIFKKNKDYKSAYFHLAQSELIRESLLQDDQQKNISQLQFRFDLEKRDLLIAAQNNDLRNSRNMRWFFGIGMLVLLVLLGFTWQQMKAKQVANQRLELLMKELHHRVKNNLQMLTSMFRLQARQTKDVVVANVLNDSRLRLESMSLMHQQLYGYQDINHIDLKKFIEDLLEKLTFSYKIENINTNVESDLMNINMDKALPIGLIINELLTNSFKYAFSENEHPSIQIVIKNNVLQYRDNGKGIDFGAATQQPQSTGMQLIDSFAQQIKSQYSFKNDNGLCFEMTLPNEMSNEQLRKLKNEL